MKLYITFTDPFDKISDGETTFEVYVEQGLELNHQRLNYEWQGRICCFLETEWGKEAYFTIETEGDLTSLDADFTIMSEDWLTT